MIEKRTHERVACAISAELRPPAGAAVFGNVSDLSISGCYINLSFPLRVGTAVEIGLWIGDDKKVMFHGVVRSATPQVGNGIEFVHVTPEQDAALQQLIARR